jgi:hypothetical protein
MFFIHSLIVELKAARNFEAASLSSNSIQVVREIDFRALGPQQQRTYHYY